MTSTTQECLRENADAECSRPRSSVGLFEPFIRAEGIRWRGGVGKVPLTFELTFENPHSHATKETPAVLRAADFGAFRPWTPLRTLLIPPIQPRSRYTLEVGAEPEQKWARQFPTLARILDGRLRYDERRIAWCGAVPCTASATSTSGWGTSSPSRGTAATWKA